MNAGDERGAFEAGEVRSACVHAKSQGVGTNNNFIGLSTTTTNNNNTKIGSMSRHEDLMQTIRETIGARSSAETTLWVAEDSNLIDHWNSGS